MKKNSLFFLVLLFTGIILVISCSKSSEDQLAPKTTCDTVAVKYSSTIISILQTNCYSCHGVGNTGGSGGILLEGYANLKKWADNGYLVGNITHASGFVAMPYGKPKMSDCEIKKIVAWVRQGSLNN